MPYALVKSVFSLVRFKGDHRPRIHLKIFKCVIGCHQSSVIPLSPLTQFDSVAILGSVFSKIEKDLKIYSGGATVCLLMYKCIQNTRIRDRVAAVTLTLVPSKRSHSDTNLLRLRVDEQKIARCWAVGKLDPPRMGYCLLPGVASSRAAAQIKYPVQRA